MELINMLGARENPIMKMLYLKISAHIKYKHVAIGPILEAIAMLSLIKLLI